MTPDDYTIKEFFLEVSHGHQLYVQEWGNAKGLPIIFLHGGPGSQVKDKHKQVFDPKLHHVIFFDQRGCGQSLPYGSLDNNTTDDLIADIHQLSKHLSLTSFVLVGGSWGSTLALAYGLAHPEDVRAMVLRGVITGSQAEVDWVDKGHFRMFYPDVWEAYQAAAPKSHQKDPSPYHFARTLSNDESVAQASGHAYATLEGSILSLDDRFEPGKAEDYDPSGIRIEIHYLSKRFFLPDRFVLDNAHKLTMPIWLIQGRYDMVNPPINAYELNKKLPRGHLVLTMSSHRAEHEDHSVMRTILTQLADAP